MSLGSLAASLRRTLLFLRGARIGISIIGAMCSGKWLVEWCWQDGVGRMHVTEFMQFMGAVSLSVTKIIACLIRDKKEGGHPELRIMAA